MCSVYTNETVDSLVVAGNGFVEFDLHQREVYGEWGFKWVYDDILAHFNLTDVGCAPPCPGEVCETGPVSPAPLSPAISHEYDGGEVTGVIVVGAYLAVCVGFIVFLSVLCAGRK